MPRRRFAFQNLSVERPSGDAKTSGFRPIDPGRTPNRTPVSGIVFVLRKGHVQQDKFTSSACWAILLRRVFELLRVCVVLIEKPFLGCVPPEPKAPAGSFLSSIWSEISDLSPMGAGVLGVMAGLFAVVLDVV